MTSVTVFYALAASGVYEFVVVWWREAKAKALVVSITLASLQLVIVVASTYLTDVAGQPAGPSAQALFLVFIRGLVPLSLVQVFLVARRKPDLYRQSTLRGPVGRLVGRNGTGWIMILVMAQIAIGMATYNAWTGVDIAVLALHLATLLAMVLIQTGRMGPRPRDPVAETFE